MAAEAAIIAAITASGTIGGMLSEGRDGNVGPDVGAVPEADFAVVVPVKVLVMVVAMVEVIEPDVMVNVVMVVVWDVTFSVNCAPACGW
jgi:hypothetical protein